MSDLTGADKIYIEKILDMGSGYVLDFSDLRFGQFFRRFGVDIHSAQYQIYGTSKANKMRAFWERESDAVVGEVLLDMLNTYEALCHSGHQERDDLSLQKSREVVARLRGDLPNKTFVSDEEFLRQQFDIPDVQKLPVDFAVSEIISFRLEEAQLCLHHGAYLSVIFLCGSVLEAVLLGVAQKKPEAFNRSPASPKRDGKPKPLHEWSLSELINVAHEIGLLKPDVKKFGHGLRDFRNYIHPYQQMLADFNPDRHTAEICMQVLKAALASVAGER